MPYTISLCFLLCCLLYKIPFQKRFHDLHSKAETLNPVQSHLYKTLAAHPGYTRLYCRKAQNSWHNLGLPQTFLHGHVVIILRHSPLKEILISSFSFLFIYNIPLPASCKIIIKICTPHYTSLAKYDVHYIFYLSVFFVKYRKSTLERV